LSKPKLEFTPTGDVEWSPADERCPGLSERVLASDPQSGVATRILRFDPGTDTTPMGTLTHEFWEEVYILSGDIHDHILERTFVAGDYACRPPGMRHGPWLSSRGCLTFEVRYVVATGDRELAGCP
jgi:ChrR-like protein with cupin domain